MKNVPNQVWPKWLYHNTNEKQMGNGVLRFITLSPEICDISKPGNKVVNWLNAV